VVNDIAIYVEGGGDTAQTLDPFRRGMSAFLKPVVDKVRRLRIRWRIIPCGGRQQAYNAFVDALANEPEVFNLLLVDSEDPVSISVSPWEHLKGRVGDKWDKPAGADDSHCQMMVACMEAWFLADPSALKKHFGGKFNEKALPSADRAELSIKEIINESLKKATKPTPASEYQKIRDGAKLLATVNPVEVRSQCKWCERLFETLEKAIGDSD
jgi:hypothetical protein